MVRYMYEKCWQFQRCCLSFWGHKNQMLENFELSMLYVYFFRKTFDSCRVWYTLW